MAPSRRPNHRRSWAALFDGDALHAEIVKVFQLPAVAFEAIPVILPVTLRVALHLKNAEFLERFERRHSLNNTREDGRDFLKLAAEIPLHPQVQVFDLEDANKAVLALKTDAIRGAAVLRI